MIAQHTLPFFNVHSNNTCRSSWSRSVRSRKHRLMQEVTDAK